jgi:AraC-like DNA-binding protein/mannose-6-phosphate isomerase-like protein (cupin superfamily)
MISYNFISPNDKNFGTKLLPHPIAVSNIYTAHNFNWKKKFYFSGESHKYHEAVFVLEGEVTVSEDDRIYHLKSGDFIVHAPYEFHRISTDTGAQVLLFSFETEGAFPNEVYDGFFALSIEEEAAFCRLFDKIYTFYHGEAEDGGCALEIASALPAFLLSLATPHRAHHASAHSKSEEEYKKLVEAMRDSVRENLSLEEIAERCHTSVRYVKHLFHRYADVGAKSYYTTLRLNETVRLLDEGVTVAEIARRLNFSSPEYMSLFFKKHTGKTPAEYKKEAHIKR